MGIKIYCLITFTLKSTYLSLSHQVLIFSTNALDFNSIKRHTYISCLSGYIIVSHRSHLNDLSLSDMKYCNNYACSHIVYAINVHSLCFYKSAEYDTYEGHSHSIITVSSTQLGRNKIIICFWLSTKNLQRELVD